MQVNVSFSIPGLGTDNGFGGFGGSSGTSGTSGLPNFDGTQGLGGLSGSNGGLSSPLMQKLLQLFKTLLQSMLQDPATKPPEDQGSQQAPGGSGQGGGGSGRPGGAQGGPGGATQGPGTPALYKPQTPSDPTLQDNPFLRIGADSLGSKADGKVSKEEEAAYQRMQKDVAAADFLNKQIAADPSMATPETLAMLSSLNKKIMKELPGVSIDAMRAHRAEIKPLLGDYAAGSQAAAAAADPTSVAGAALGINDAAVQYATGSKAGTWGAANLRDKLLPADGPAIA